MAKTASKWAAKLKKGKSQWAKSEERYNEMFAGRDLPEDVYVAKLQEASFVDSKAQDGSETVSIKRSFAVIEGEHRGVVVSDRLNLFHETGAAFVRKWLRTMDVENVDDLEIEDLEDVLAEFNSENPICKIRVKQGDFTNVEVLSLVGEDEVEGSAGEGEEGEEGTEDGDDEGEEIDLDAMDEEALRALIADQEIDPIENLGFASKLKYKKASETDLRDALTEYFTEGGSEEGEESEAGEGTEGVEDDELLEEAKLFCGTQDIALEDDDDLDTIKEKIEAESPYKEKDLDEDEKALLGKLGLESCIKKAAAPTKIKTKVGKKK